VYSILKQKYPYHKYKIIQAVMIIILHYQKQYLSCWHLFNFKSHWSHSQQCPCTSTSQPCFKLLNFHIINSTSNQTFAITKAKSRNRKQIICLSSWISVHCTEAYLSHKTIQTTKYNWFLFNKRCDLTIPNPNSSYIYVYTHKSHKYMLTH